MTLSPVGFALRRPVTVLVLAAAVLVGAWVAVSGMPIDIFPHLNLPVIYVVQPYAGMAPSQMEGQIVTYYEYHFLYVNGIEHVESESIQGLSIVKLYFHPDADISQALAQVTAMAFRSLAFMPPGTLPPFILRYGAGSIPVGQLVFSSERRSGTEIQDLVTYQVRPLVATLPGVSGPPPTGGRVRMIVVDVDPGRLRSYRISPEDVATALVKGNLTLPSGNIGAGKFFPLVATNAMAADFHELERLPLRIGAGPTIFLRDVGKISDSADLVYDIALVNGRHTVYMSLTKDADASTLSVVAAIKAALPRMQAVVPPDVHIRFEFDQSVYVKASLRGLALEGALGALLTGLMVLVFLGDWRSVLIVIVVIPFSILGAIVGLRIAGQTLNLMTIGGLALAVGILVDEATVAIENIHTHLKRGTPARRAVLDAMNEVILPRFLAVLCIVAVFLPTFSMTGIGRALFPPLSLAVAFAMLASFLLASTLLPVLSVWLFQHRPRAQEKPGRFARFQDGYARFEAAAVGHPAWTLGSFALVVLGCLALGGLGLGTSLFPPDPEGQMQVHVRAPAGTRLEQTEAIVRGVTKEIDEAAGPGLVRISLANIGPPPWEYPSNATFVWNSGPQDALLMVALNPGRRPSVAQLQEELRGRLARRFPGVAFSFEPGDIVSQVMNFGSPTPVSVSVAGNDLVETRAFAETLLRRLVALPSLRDVQIPMPLDYPTIDVHVDRERAGQLGVDIAGVTKSIVAATSSSVLVVPNYWTDPKTGLPYRVAVRVPQHQLNSMQSLASLPAMLQGNLRPYVSDVASVSRGHVPGEFDHYDSQRTITITANMVGEDLGRVGREVEQVLREAGPPPRGSVVQIRGQIAQLKETLSSLDRGLALAVVVVLLLLVGNFQSWREAAAILAILPAVLAGVSVALLSTGSTINVESMMGAIMAIGVAVANAVLLVTFANERRRAGDDPYAAAVAGARARIRAILMTGLAMMVGMVPMALGLTEGGKQTAPLGRAVIGGILFSMIATLLVLPVIYAALSRKGVVRSPSLHPEAEPS